MPAKKAVVYIATDASPCAMNTLESAVNHKFHRVKPHLKEVSPREEVYHSLMFKRLDPSSYGYKLELEPYSLRGRQEEVILKNTYNAPPKFKVFDMIQGVDIERYGGIGFTTGDRVLNTMGRVVYPGGHTLQDSFEDSFTYSIPDVDAEWINTSDFVRREIKNQLTVTNYDGSTWYDPTYSEPEVILPKQIVSLYSTSSPGGLHDAWQGDWTSTGLPWKSVTVLTAKQRCYSRPKAAWERSMVTGLQVLEDASLLTENSDFDFDALLIVPRFWMH